MRLGRGARGQPISVTDRRRYARRPVDPSQRALRPACHIASASARLDCPADPAKTIDQQTDGTCRLDRIVPQRSVISSGP